MSRYIVFDESGDPGFKFEKGASSYLVFSLLFTNDLECVRGQVARLREQLKLPAGHEFKFHRTSDTQKMAFFAAVEPCLFTLSVAVVDKQSLPDSFRKMGKWRLYSHFITELILRAPADQVQGAVMILDEKREAIRVARLLRVNLSKTMKECGREYRLGKIVLRDSHRENAIQVADMAAGAILWSVTGKNDAFCRRIRRRIVDWWDVPPKENLSR